MPLISCELFYVEKHSVSRLMDAHYIFTDASNNAYFRLDTGRFVFFDQNHIDNKLYFYHYRDISFADNVDGQDLFHVSHIVSNSDFVVVGGFTHNQTAIGRIAIFDKKLSLQKTLVLEEGLYIRGMVCTEDNLYAAIFNNNIETCCLHKINLNSLDDIILEEDVSNLQSFVDSDVHIFFGYSFKMYKYSDKTMLEPTWDETNKRSIYRTDDYCVFLDGDEFHIRLKDNGCKIKNNYGINHLYNKVYLIDHYLMFAGLNYKSEKNCFTYKYSHGYPCICGLKESYLFTFDLNTLELVSCKEFKKGTYLIDYDLNSAQYYYNGGLYNGNYLVRDCETIVPGEIKKFNRLEGYREEWDNCHFYLSYYNGDFYGI